MANPTYVISGEERERFSRSHLVKSLLPVGFNYHLAYALAEKIREDIKSKNITEIKKEKIAKIVEAELKKINPESARRYNIWRKIKYTKPLIILIGGGTGVGTSTLASELANLLGITKVIGTDSVREVMRSTISKSIVPSIYKSTYNAWEVYGDLLPFRASVLHAYDVQVQKVSFGVNAMINRAFREKESVIIEGVHILPGYFENHKNTFEYIIDISDQKMHRFRFYRRESLTSLRPAARYLKYFVEIRDIRDYIFKKAKEKNVSIINNYHVQETLMELVKKLQDDYEKKNSNKKK
jgi:2-phosphoglycerate kinase